MDKLAFGEAAYHNGYDKGFKDGVNKFAELLQEKVDKAEIVCSGALVRTDYTITANQLNNLLKELTDDKE